MVPFLDDDAGYLHWLSTHPDGFVLNTYRNPTPGYLMLHHATCRQARARSNWTKDYRKTCGTRDELETFARNDIGREPRLCTFCFRARA